MTKEEALRLRAGDRICVPSRLPNAHGGTDMETETVKIVVHSPDDTSIRALTTTARSFRPPEIARRRCGDEERTHHRTDDGGAFPVTTRGQMQGGAPSAVTTVRAAHAVRGGNLQKSAHSGEDEPFRLGNTLSGRYRGIMIVSSS
jgi:hypothetical protein